MDRKTWLAFLVCIIIYLVWFEWVMPYFSPPPPKKPATAPTAKEAPAKPEPAEPAPAAAKKAEGQTAEAPPAAPTAPAATALKSLAEEEKFTLDAADLLMKTDWTNEGGSLEKLTFKDYFTDVTHKENVVLLAPIEDEYRTLSLIDSRSRSADPAKRQQALPLDKTRYSVAERAERKIVFRAAFSNGLEVSKAFEVLPKKHDIRVRVTLRNAGQAPLQQGYSIVAPAGIVPDETLYLYVTSQIAIEVRHGGESMPAAQRPVDVRVKTADSLKGVKEEVQGEIAWAAVTNKYFLTLVWPQQEGPRWLLAASASGLAPKAEPPHADKPNGASPVQNVLTELTTILFDIKPGQSLSQDYLFFAGPKSASLLQTYGSAARVLDYDYGMFGSITKLFLWMLAALHRMVPNFGLGIIVLTLLVKVVLHPLTRKTQISMYKMQKLQPKITALREKYKNDQKTLGQEQWKLFREHRVNPLGGCLPMFLQIPVLIALYNGIAYSVEFRQQPFFAWIKDLARPDTLAILPFNIPFLGNELNILPIAMVVTWVIQQQTMPKPVDPQQIQQQKIMMFMPLIFGFMFYAMPSGLVLYWLTNTFLGIIEQYYIKKSLAKIVIE